MSSEYTEDIPIQQQLGGESVYTYNNKDFGLDHEKHKLTSGDIV